MSVTVYNAIERILDDECAWIARPSAAVTTRIALAAVEAVETHITELEAEITRLRAALEQARVYVESDECNHGRTFGTGNAIRAALDQKP